MSEEILRGSFKGKDLIKITVRAPEGIEKHLDFEAIKTAAAEPQKELAQAASSDAT
jgi:hypothetical protein